MGRHLTPTQEAAGGRAGSLLPQLVGGTWGSSPCPAALGAWMQQGQPALQPLVPPYLGVGGGKGAAGGHLMASWPQGSGLTRARGVDTASGRAQLHLADALGKLEGANGLAHVPLQR